VWQRIEPAAGGIGQVVDLPDAPGTADVVLLHGFLSSPLSMWSIAKALRSVGFAPYLPWYETWSCPFEDTVDKLCTVLSERAIGTGRTVHFVAHSMGGLVARAVIARLQPIRIGRLVMLGTPNGGSELADFAAASPILRTVLGCAGPALVTRRDHPAIAALGSPDYPVGVIAGNRPLPGLLRILPMPHDGKVSVAATHVDGEADHIVLPVTHTLMPFDRRVREQVLAFLREGRFAR